MYVNIYVMLSGECRKNGIWQRKVDVNHWQPGAQAGTLLTFEKINFVTKYLEFIPCLFA